MGEPRNPTNGLDPEDPGIPEDAVFRDLNRFSRRFSSLDEQALVLAAAAFAEDVLGSILQEFMLENSSARELIEGFNAPLGSFSTRIRACHALGLILDRQSQDLNLLRKIRNAFSHTWEEISFRDTRVIGWTNALNYSNLREPFPDTTVDKFRSSISGLLTELHVLKRGNRSAVLRTTVKATGLIAGFSGLVDEQMAEATRLVQDIDAQLVYSVGKKTEYLTHSRILVLQGLEMTFRAAPKDRRREVQGLIDRLSQKREL